MLRLFLIRLPFFIIPKYYGSLTLETKSKIELNMADLQCLFETVCTLNHFLRRCAESVPQCVVEHFESHRLTMINTCFAVDYCKDVTCNNGGTCVNQFNSFKCVCQGSFTGIFCDEGKWVSHAHHGLFQIVSPSRFKPIPSGLAMISSLESDLIVVFFDKELS